MAEDDLYLDLSGLKCPLPSLFLERTLREAKPGTIVFAVATDPMAEVDLPFSAQRHGATVLMVESLSGRITVRVKKN